MIKRCSNPSRGSLAARLAAGLLLLVAVLTLLGCGDANRRYRILSFWFDGVPDPNASTFKTKQTGASGRPIYVHRPYAENKCDSCHQNNSSDDVFTRTQVQADACYQCHRDVPGRYAAMHGPVASGRCTLCHAAHQSTEPHLLKYPSPRVCQTCHETSSLGQRPAEHLDPKADCLSCHQGHGGDDLRMLKPAPGPSVVPTFTKRDDAGGMP